MTSGFLTFSAWPYHRAPNHREAQVSSADELRLEEPAENAQRPERKGDLTRRRILLAARQHFAEVGYERATIRRIADTAQADKASVIKYFGNKQELFRQAVHFRIDLEQEDSDDPGQTAENYLRGMLERWAANPHSPMAVLVRTSMTSAEAADLLREKVTREVIDHVAGAIERPDARLRAGIFAAFMMGLATHLHLLGMPDLGAADLEDIVQVAAPLIRRLIAPQE
jgi:AcrR family transcriptional regulator